MEIEASPRNGYARSTRASVRPGASDSPILPIGAEEVQTRLAAAPVRARAPARRGVNANVPRPRWEAWKATNDDDDTAGQGRHASASMSLLHQALQPEARTVTESAPLSAAGAAVRSLSFWAAAVTASWGARPIVSWIRKRRAFPAAQRRRSGFTTPLLVSPRAGEGSTVGAHQLGAPHRSRTHARAGGGGGGGGKY